MAAKLKNQISKKNKINLITLQFKYILFLIKTFYIILILIVTIFFGGVVIGYSLPFETQKMIIEIFKKQFADILTSTDFFMFLKIFYNNLKISIMLVFLGFTLILPLAMILINGVVLGIAAGLIINKSAIGANSIINVLISILPHGIIELPVILFCAFLSTILGLKFYFKKGILPKKTLKEFFIEIIKLFVFIIIPLLLIAAFIEVYVTKALAVGLS